jgi:H+/Cl- antiporter ClcA
MNRDDRFFSFLGILIGVFGMVMGCFRIFYRHEHWYHEWDTLQLVPMWIPVVFGAFAFVFGVVTLRSRKHPPGPGQKQD